MQSGQVQMIFRRFVGGFRFCGFCSLMMSCSM